MDEKERALKDIKKLENRINEFKKFGFDTKYNSVFEYALNYFNDSKHFFDEGKYFTSFGAANYAYGFLDAILVIEGKMGESSI